MTYYTNSPEIHDQENIEQNLKTWKTIKSKKPVF